MIVFWKYFVRNSAWQIPSPILDQLQPRAHLETGPSFLIFWPFQPKQKSSWEVGDVKRMSSLKYRNFSVKPSILLSWEKRREMLGWYWLVVVGFLFRIRIYWFTWSSIALLLKTGRTFLFRNISSWITTFTLENMQILRYWICQRLIFIVSLSIKRFRVSSEHTHLGLEILSHLGIWPFVTIWTLRIQGAYFTMDLREYFKVSQS